MYEKIKVILPLPHFTHKFVRSIEPEETLLDRADVIIADLSGTDAVETVRFLCTRKKQDGELLLLADKGQAELLMEQDISEVADIWTMPLSDKEFQFRFMKWQRDYKTGKDFWQSRNYLDTLINSVPHLIWFKDKKGAHIKVNESFCKAVNKTMEQIEGREHYYIWDISPEEYARGEYICMESEYEVMEKRETCIFDENVKIGDSMRQLKTFKAPLVDLDGSVMGTVGVAIDVTQERMYEDMIIKNANTDFLTGLYNRRYVYEYIDQMEEQPITIFCIDLDKFKSINDSYGHQEGDRALVLTADVMRECMQGSMIARTGGDEFLIVMLGEHTEQEIEETRIMIGQKINSAYAKEEHFRKISASVGSAHSKAGKEVFDMLVGEADAFMYGEKERKKKAMGIRGEER